MFRQALLAERWLGDILLRGAPIGTQGDGRLSYFPLVSSCHIEVPVYDRMCVFVRLNV